MDIVQLSMFDGKVCMKCKEWKNYVEFGKNRARKDGHQDYCYSCRSRAKAPLKADPSQPRFRAMHIDRSTDGKVCPGCQKWKQISAFKKRQTDGKYRHAYCVDCNRVKKQIHRREYPEKVNATRRVYYHRNHNQIRVRQKLKYDTNPEKYRSRALAFARNNPDKWRAWQHRRRARELGAEGSYTDQEWKAMCDWFGGVCLACGGQDKITVDHVIPLVCGGSNWIINLQPLCRSCNSSKQDKTIDYRDPGHLAIFLEHIRCQSEDTTNSHQ